MKLLIGNKIQSIIDFTKKRTVLTITIVVLISALASCSISIFLSNEGNLTLSSKGNLKAVGIETYWDPDGKNKTETINWSDIWIGSPKSVTIYVQSISNYATKLELQTTNWNPDSISNYASVSWDYNGELIEPNEIVKIVLTLTINDSLFSVDDSAIAKRQNFDVNIHIIASA